MSKFNWRNGFTVGLVVGGGLVIIGTLLFSSGQDETTQLTYAIDQATNKTYQCGDGNEPVWGPWFGLCFGLYDSIAQWLMMAFTIVAAGLLYGTLLQANRTNQAAISATEAAHDANSIMRNEQRPWVILHRDVNCDFYDLGHGGRITWNYNFENKGRGPAYDVKMDFTFIKRAHFQNMTLQLEGFLQNVLSKPRLSTLAVLFPGESTNFVHYQARGMTRYQEDGFSVQPVSNEGHIMMMACLTYRLAHNSDDFGYDVRMFGIEESKQWIGPWGHTMLEHASARLIG